MTTQERFKLAFSVARQAKKLNGSKRDFYEPLFNLGFDMEQILDLLYPNPDATDNHVYKLLLTTGYGEVNLKNRTASLFGRPVKLFNY